MLRNHMYDGPGPFQADQIQEVDPYELSNGHPIHCYPGGADHAEL